MGAKRRELEKGVGSVGGGLDLSSGTGAGRPRSGEVPARQRRARGAPDERGTGRAEGGRRLANSADVR